MTDEAEVAELLDIAWRRAVERAESWSSSAAHWCSAIPSADRGSCDYHAVVVGPWRPQQLEQLMRGAEAILRNQGRYRSLVTVEVERDTWFRMQIAIVLVAVDQMPDLALAAGVLGLSWNELNSKICATE